MWEIDEVVAKTHVFLRCLLADTDDKVTKLRNCCAPQVRFLVSLEVEEAACSALKYSSKGQDGHGVGLKQGPHQHLVPNVLSFSTNEGQNQNNRTC